MYPLDLPEPLPADAQPLRDVKEASAWLVSQPQAQPLQMLVALQKAIAAIDASDIAPAERLDILDVLRSAVIKAQSTQEPRYTRKPLPLLPGEAEIFFASRKLWRTLAVAYLRTVAQHPAAATMRPLHRAALALRLEQYAHFLAAYEVPDDLLQLMYGVLSCAEELGVHETPLEDPSYKHMGDSHIAGHVACAFMLHFVDPYRLSVAELTVTHRAFGRWRELATFQAVPDSDPKARALPLGAVLGESSLAPGRSRWLDVRMVVRKLRRRLEALESGEGPESLQLGRELSAAACTRLLHQLKDALRPGKVLAKALPEEGSAALVFEPDHIYALFTGKRLEPVVAPPQKKPAVDYQRLAVFGFDKIELKAPPEAPVEVPSENWQMAGDLASRMDESGRRLAAPCLVGGRLEEPRQVLKLGVLSSLLVVPGGRLRGVLQWYGAKVHGVSVQLPSPGGKESPAPAFVLEEETGLALVLPAGAPVRPDSKLTLEGSNGPRQVLLGQALERGSDFIRYAIQPG